MRKVMKPRRWMVLIGLHVMFVALSARCGPGTVGHGTFYLTVPNDLYGDLDVRDVEFFLDEPVGRGEIKGYVTATRCEVFVTLCDGYYCEDIFYSSELDGTVHFQVDSEDSYVFESFLDSFVPCYKEGEMLAEPFSCQRWDCEDSVHDITIMLESLDPSCPATLVAEMDVDYLDVRVPFLGLCGGALLFEDADDCDGYDCDDLDQEF